MEDEVYRAAKERADSIAPLPKEEPIAAGVHGYAVVWMVGLAVYMFQLAVPIMWAIALAAFVSGFFAWVDCRSRWRRHSREFQAAAAFYENDPRLK